MAARRRSRNTALVAFALLATTMLIAVARRIGDRVASPAASQAIPVGSSTHTIRVGGLQRDFLVYRPARLSRPASLVVMLHGGYGSAAYAERAYGWDQQADAGHFLVAYPDGYHHAWNTGGGCCGIPAAENVDDVAFITDVVRTIEREMPVARSRVYATGISNGGIIAYTLACKTSVFAAIGPDSATQLGACPAPHPLSVIHIHGTADTHIPYHGGIGPGPAHIDAPPIPALNATWRGIDHCAAPRITTTGVLTTSIASCPRGRAVELITIAGAGHQWPAAKPNPLAQQILHSDPPSTALSATATIWRFFAAHPAR